MSDDEYEHSITYTTMDAKEQRDTKARELRKERDPETKKLLWWVQIESDTKKGVYSVYWSKR